MKEKPPGFGDVYEWAVPTGVVRWFVICPALNGQSGNYEGLMLQTTPDFPNDSAMTRPVPIGIDVPDNFFHPHAPKTRLAQGTEP